MIFIAASILTYVFLTPFFIYFGFITVNTNAKIFQLLCIGTIIFLSFGMNIPLNNTSRSTFYKILGFNLLLFILVMVAMYIVFSYIHRSNYFSGFFLIWLYGIAISLFSGTLYATTLRSLKCAGTLYKKYFIRMSKTDPASFMSITSWRVSPFEVTKFILSKQEFKQIYTHTMNYEDLSHLGTKKYSVIYKGCARISTRELLDIQTRISLSLKTSVYPTAKKLISLFVAGIATKFTFLLKFLPTPIAHFFKIDPILANAFILLWIFALLKYLYRELKEYRSLSLIKSIVGKELMIRNIHS